MGEQSRTIVLLPGLDGTGDLLETFAAKAPAEWRVRLLRYPVDEELGYGQLLEMIERQLADEESFVLLGESFGGPLAVMYAQKYPEKVQALVLCVSFVVSPVPRWFALLARLMIFNLEAPTWVIQWLLAGKGAERDLLELVKKVTRKVDARVVGYRIREVIAVDCRDELKGYGGRVCCIRARQDNLVKEKSLREMVAKRKDVVVKELDGPHMLLESKPGECWDVIEEFTGGFVTA